MRSAGIIIVAANAMFTTSAARAEDWTCSAKNLADYSYSGGASAYIRLTMFAQGASYPVQRLSANRVKGVTGNGTEFFCQVASSKK